MSLSQNQFDFFIIYICFVLSIIWYSYPLAKDSIKLQRNKNVETKWNVKRKLRVARKKCYFIWKIKTGVPVGLVNRETLKHSEWEKNYDGETLFRSPVMVAKWLYESDVQLYRKLGLYCLTNRIVKEDILVCNSYPDDSRFWYPPEVFITACEVLLPITRRDHPQFEELVGYVFLERESEFTTRSLSDVMRDMLEDIAHRARLCRALGHDPIALFMDC